MGWNYEFIFLCPLPQFHIYKPFPGESLTTGVLVVCFMTQCFCSLVPPWQTVPLADCSLLPPLADCSLGRLFPPSPLDRLFPPSPLADCPLVRLFPPSSLGRQFSTVGWGQSEFISLLNSFFVSRLLQFHSICMSPLLLESVSGYCLWFALRGESLGRRLHILCNYTVYYTVYSIL